MKLPSVAITIIAILLSLSLWQNTHLAVLLSFVFTWVLLICIGMDIYKLSVQNELFWSYLKSKEDKEKRSK